MTVFLQTLLAFNAALIIPLIGLVIYVSMDSYIQKENRFLFVLSALISVILLLQGQAEYFISEGVPDDELRTVVSAIGYILRPVLIVVFIRIVRKRNDIIFLATLLVLNTVTYSAMFVPGLREYVVSFHDNIFHRGLMGHMCAIVSVFLMSYLVIVCIIEYGRVRRNGAIIPTIIGMIVLTAVAADAVVGINTPITFLNSTVAGCSLFFYVWLHLNFAWDHEEALIAEQKIQIMISQIQPHFMYNTLSTIQALCKIDPDKAFEITGKFGVYLRQNIDSLNSETVIPFEKELDHTRVYTDIEQVRFPSLSIVFDIKDNDFYIPALSIQPMVENAIRHGVRSKKHGLVAVETRREGGEHVIVIRDNGVGFDPNATISTDRSHIGLQNVRDRIEQLCGGSFDIESHSDSGTIITMRIPVVQGNKGRKGKEV